MNQPKNWWSKIKEKTIYYIDLCNPFTYSTLIQEIKNDTDHIITKLDKDDLHIARLEEELNNTKILKGKYKSLLNTIGDTIPDMIWYKDENGNYKYANQTLIDSLFYGIPKDEVIGKNDTVLGKKCKEMVGDSYHTFGVICGNSDEEILTTLKKQRFLEWGLINGEETYLEVHKAPIYNEDGDLIGTVGTGRDVTEYYIGLLQAIDKLEESIKIIDNCSNINTKICSLTVVDSIKVLKQQLDRYKFEVET
jgi:PAS domain S-box-containing protein